MIDTILDEVSVAVNMKPEPRRKAEAGGVAKGGVAKGGVAKGGVAKGGVAKGGVAKGSGGA
jgi:hypothetical protein